MDLKSALKKGEAILKAVNNKSASNDARVILSNVLNCSKIFLIANYDYQLTEDEEAKFAELIELRAKGVPLQYITGKQEFMSLQFKVNSNVLIPRQETEILVETIIDYIKNKRGILKERNAVSKKNTNSGNKAGSVSIDKSDDISILEIGTGSGCIAVSLAYYIQNCFITATDISEDAIQTARLNASLNGVKEKIDFVVSDLFENVGNKKFDAIVSNPPYIAKKDIESLDVEVKKYEPIIALDGGIDGLDFYRAIIQKAPDYLKEDGILVFEIGYNQARDVACLMERDFSNIRIIKDLDKNDRVVIGGIDIERI